MCKKQNADEAHFSVKASACVEETRRHGGQAKEVQRYIKELDDIYDVEEFQGKTDMFGRPICPLPLRGKMPLWQILYRYGHDTERKDGDILGDQISFLATRDLFSEVHGHQPEDGWVFEDTDWSTSTILPTGDVLSSRIKVVRLELPTQQHWLSR